MKSSACKVLCACIAALFLLLGMASCKGEPKNPDATVSEQTAEDTSHLYDKNGYLKDQLPDDLNFDRTVRILGNLNQQSQFYAETATEDRINNAIYSRNETVCTRLGVDLEWDLQPGSWEKQSSFIRRVELANQDKPYDAVVAYNLIPPAMAIRGLCTNLLDTDYIHIESPWWPAGYVEELVMQDQIYSLAESCGVGVLKNMMCIFFNNSLIASKGLENPYDLVENNQWTLDKLMTMIEGTYENLNTSGETDVDSKDLFGLCTSTAARLDAWFYASGYRLSGTDGNGNLISQMGGSHVEEHISRIQRLFLNSNDVWLVDDKQNIMFSENRAVFYATVVSITNKLKNLDIDFGVVPMPKLNSEQEKYGTHLANGHDVWCIPKLAADVQCSSALLECMASESYRQVNAIYYDNQLKHRFSAGSQYAEKMADMYDLIRESIVFDFTYVYSCAFKRMPMLYIRYCLTDPANNNWSSTWGEVGETLESEFSKIADSFKYN